MKKDVYSPILRNQKVNVGQTERIISVIGGVFLLFDGLTKKQGSVPEALAGGYMLFRGVTGYCPMHSAIEGSPALEHSDNINIKVDLTVNRNRMEVYNLWRHLENLPSFLTHIQSVQELDDTISVWKASGPGGVGTIKWKAEIVKDDPGRFLGWHSLPGSDIVNAGKVEFLDDEETGGTKLHVVISYKALFGVPGKELSRLLHPLFRDIISEDVLRFKDYAEKPAVEA